MFKQKLVIIPLSLNLDWTTDYYEQTALLLKREGNIVLFYRAEPMITFSSIWKTKKIPLICFKTKLNIFQINTIQVLPFRRFPNIERLNIKINQLIFETMVNIINIYYNYEKILWIFSPHQFKYFENYKKIKIIYDCVDYRLENDLFDNSNCSYEKKLLQKADLVTVISHTLKDKLSKYRKHIPIVPQGFRLESYKKYPPKKKIKKRNTLGYIGGLNWRVDFDLILFLSKRFKSLNFVLVGNFQESGITNIDTKVKRKITQLKKMKNITLITDAKKESLPQIVNTFDIGLIPYTDSVFNLNCYPMKVFEYFYVGIPVISSEIFELHRFQKYIFIATTPMEWIETIIKISKQDWPNNFRINQKKIAINNSWSKKLEAISDNFHKIAH